LILQGLNHHFRASHLCHRIYPFLPPLRAALTQQKAPEGQSGAHGVKGENLPAHTPFQNADDKIIHLSNPLPTHSNLSDLMAGQKARQHPKGGIKCRRRE
jgi:hypothetical protein